MHKPVKYTIKPEIDLTHTDKSMNDLEQFLMAVQSMINLQIKQGKAGIIVNHEKIPYKRMLGVLYAMKVYFSQKGCFSFGICKDCSQFNNAGSATGLIGTCKSSEKFAFDSCPMYTEDCNEQ